MSASVTMFYDFSGSNFIVEDFCPSQQLLGLGLQLAVIFDEFWKRSIFKHDVIHTTDGGRIYLLLYGIPSHRFLLPQEEGGCAGAKTS